MLLLLGTPEAIRKYIKEMLPDIDKYSDVVYYPRETELLRMAKEVGCKTMNGLGMMLFQGAAAFKMWTGEDMPIEYMKEKLDIK